MNGNNYNYSMSASQLNRIRKILEKKHICNVCRKKVICAYVEPFLCERCAIEVYEGRN